MPGMRAWRNGTSEPTPTQLRRKALVVAKDVLLRNGRCDKSTSLTTERETRWYDSHTIDSQPLILDNRRTRKEIPCDHIMKKQSLVRKACRDT